MDEQATTMSGRTASSPSVGFGAFALGLAGAFTAGALIVSMLPAQGGATVTTPTVEQQVQPGLATPMPTAISTVKAAPGDEYRRIPDDGSRSRSATPMPTAAVRSAPGDEYQRIP